MMMTMIRIIIMTIIMIITMTIVTIIIITIIITIISMIIMIIMIIIMSMDMVMAMVTIRLTITIIWQLDVVLLDPCDNMSPHVWVDVCVAYVRARPLSSPLDWRHPVVRPYIERSTSSVPRRLLHPRGQH